MTTPVSLPILSCRELSVGYKDQAVLSGLNLSFEPGQFISLLGPNGAGKTTLLRTLSRHLPPLGGEIHINGRPLQDIRQSDLAKIMAVVLTDKVTPPLFTVFEFASLGRYPHTDLLGRLTSKDQAAVHGALAAVHAEDLANRQFANLSDGERQKALVARALAQEPRLLLLDEPTIHLDLKHRIEVMNILRTQCRSQGITVVASLHDVDIAAKVSDKVGLIKNGSCVGFGSPEEILESGAVNALYDFSGAVFDQHLGSLEMRSDGSRGKVFVAAGFGSGALIFRLLAKRGFSIVTGILPSNDLDCYVARSLGADCVVRNLLEPTNGELLREALDRLKDCETVIDAGFGIGAATRDNLSLLEAAKESGKTVFTLRSEGVTELAGMESDRLFICPDPVHLLNSLENFLDHQNGQDAKSEES